MSSLSPIHFILPPEVMEKIFIAALVSDLDNLSIHFDPDFSPYQPYMVPRISSTTVPLLLLRVCKIWREIALGTRPLFTKIFLYGRLKVDPWKVIPMWLDRSGSLPLDVVIQPELWSPTGPLTTANERDKVRALLDLLCNNLHRIRTLRMGEFGGSLLPSSNPELQLQTLEELTITDAEPATDPEIYDLCSIYAPELRTLQILRSRFDLSWNMHINQFYPGGNLRVFRNSSFPQTLDDLGHLLGFNPLLEICNVTQWETTQESWEYLENARIHLPCLRQLILSTPSNSENAFQVFCRFINCLDIPGQLEDLFLGYPPTSTLTMDDWYDDEENSRSSVARLIRRNSYVLKCLSLVGTPDVLFLNSLALTCLQTLTLASSRGLFSMPVAHHFFPQLSILHLYDLQIGKGMGHGRHLLRFLISKTHPESTYSGENVALQEVILDHCEGVCPEEQECINELSKRRDHVSWDIQWPVSLDPDPVQPITMSIHTEEAV